MPYEEETEYGVTHYRCIDPIENLKIKVVLKPVKNLYIPLPQFDVEQSSDVSLSQEENQSDIIEYTFQWQEKIFSRSEINKYSDKDDWKKKLSEKYHGCLKDELDAFKNHQSKLFSYVAADNYSMSENEVNIFTEKSSYISPLTHKMNILNITGSGIKYCKGIPQRKIINYYPSDDFKNQSHLINKNEQKMFIMVDLGLKSIESQTLEPEEHFEAVLCSLNYNYSTSVLQMTPSFSKSELRPYIIGTQNKNGKNYYYYWIYHASSSSIKNENLSKEIQLMSKVLDYQELKKLRIDTEFFVGNPDHVYLTLLGEIISAEGFEFDNLHIHYFIKLHSGWGYSDIDSLIGRTQTCRKNSLGICHFSHLFEMNFFAESSLFEDHSAAPLELYFEVLSVDKYKRYRNEGYTFLSLPRNPGTYSFSLRCWRVSDGTVRSQLERFFIGGGPELEDISYVGLSVDENLEVMSRFGLETIPSGTIKVKLNILHQSKNFTPKAGDLAESEQNISGRLDAGSLLGSVNTVLEAFRRARERMLQAKKGLQINLSHPLSEMKTKV